MAPRQPELAARHSQRKKCPKSAKKKEKEARKNGRGGGKPEKTEEKPEEIKEEKPEEAKPETEKAEPEEAQGEPKEPGAQTPPTGEGPLAEAPGAAAPGAAAEAAPEAAAGGARAGGAAVNAGEGAITAGEGAVAAGGSAAAAGGTAAEGVAAAETEAAVATGGVSILVQIAAVIILVIVAIILIVIIIFIVSQLEGAGRSPKQDPNPNSQADMTERGKAIANAGGGVNNLVQAKGMDGDDSFNRSKEQINNSRMLVAKNNLFIPKAEAQTPSPDLKNLAKELSLNLEVLQSGAGDDTYVAKETEKIIVIANQLKDKTNTCSTNNSDCQQIFQNADKIVNIMEEIKAYTYTKKDVSMLGKETIIKTKSGLEINPLDLQYIKDNKVDIRVLRLVNHLAEAGWDRLKISRIVDFDQTDDESRVASEDEATISAHNSGQALDISIVGTYKCSKYWGLKDFRRPCYVYYQTGFRPNNLSYGGPNGDSFSEIFTNFSFGEASNILNSGNTDGSNWSDFLVQAGINALIEQAGLTPSIFEFPTNDSGLGSYALGQSLSLDPNVFGRMANSANDDDAWAKFGAAILAQSLGMPSGSFEGSNTDEILRSIANAYIRKSLGLERTTMTSDFSPQSIGGALIEKILLTRNPDQVKERLQLSDNIFVKILNLPPEISSNYLSGNSDFNQFAAGVGNNELTKLTNAYKGAGFERALGIPAGSWPGIASNNGDITKRVGAAILARYTLMDENAAYQNPDAYVNNIDKQAAVNITTIGQTDFANFVKGQESQNKLKTIADNFIKDKSNENLNFAVRQGLIKNNISYAKITGDNFKAIFSPQTLNAILSATTNALLERSVYSYQANFGDYTMSTSDIERLRRGDLASVAYKLAGGIFDQELGLPIGFTNAIIENREATTDIMAKAGISLLAQALGVDISGEVLNESWYEPGVIPQKFAQNKIESNGLNKNTFSGTIDDVIAANGIKPVVASLGLTEEEYNLVRAGQINDYIKSKLYGVDAALGIPNGTSYSFAEGSISAEQVVSSLAASLIQTIQAGGIQGLATKLGLDANHIPSGDILGAFLGRDIGTIVNFFSSLSDSSINQELLTSKNFFSALISTNDINIENIIANEGIKILSQLINNREATQIASIFINGYLNGNPVSVPEILKRSTGITNTKDAEAFILGQAKSAISYWGIGQITNAVNQVFGNIGINYEQARVLFKGDENAANIAYQAVIARGGSAEEATKAYRDAMNQARTNAGKSVGYAYMDLGLNRLDPSLPYGTSRILIEGTDEQRTQFALAYAESKITINGRPLAPGTLVQIENFIENGDFDELGPATFASVDAALNLPLGTTQAVQAFIESNGEFGFDVSNVEAWASDSLNNWIQEQTGFDIGAIVNIEQSIASGQLTFTGDPEAMAINLLTNWLIGEFGSKIDSAIGVPGFTGALVTGLLTQNWLPMAVALLQSFFATRCQDPVAVTREHVRLVLGQSLNAPDTPSQIATFRQEDVNYYSGLKDNGDVDYRLRNVLYEKYGPVSLRVYKGMFTLPWAYDHIHEGY